MLMQGQFIQVKSIEPERKEYNKKQNIHSLFLPVLS